jgi:Papain family cysteine protease
MNPKGPQSFIRIGELRRVLRETRASWQVAQHRRDDEPMPVFGLGASPEGLPRADQQAARLDFRELLRVPIANPFLKQRRAELGLAAESAQEATASEQPPPAGGVAASVDWRNRWGWPWITTVRDQNGCNACWAFTGTALVEAMTRIEHAVWTTRSEGDVHKGVGKVCADLGNLGEVFNFIGQNGLCDPECFPWTTANIPYTPTPDRPGRTVKIGPTTWIGSIAEQKLWIDTIGPIATWFMVAGDFFGYGTGVYRRTAAAADVGGHFLLVVGYDDSQGCWIVKNSWGTGWGEGGFGRIAYGESGIEQFSKLGVRGTNPDPLTKRRLHNGNLIESGNGALHRNFEMLATNAGPGLRHWWREGASPFPWSAASSFGNDAAVCPTLTATTYGRNFEAVYLTTSNRLHHWWLNQANGTWNDGGVFGPADAKGIPGFIQGNYGAPANFEVVVRTADGRLNHWWRENGPPWTWHDGGRFASNVAYSGASLVQGREGAHGSLEVVCVLQNGQMQHWWRDDDHGFTWKLRDTFGANVMSPPCMIEGQFGAVNEKQSGNYELCVAVGGKVQHWWRNNNGDKLWRHSADFGHDVMAVTGLVEGSFGFNLEVVVLRQDKKLQHYWRDAGGWHEGPVIGPA